MRVTLVNLTSGGMSGGYKKYLEIMLPLLAAHPSISRLELASPEGLAFQRDPRVPEWTWPAGDARSGFAALRGHLRERNADVVFIPTARMIRTGLPTVVMVRNMEPLVAPFTGNSLADGIRNVARRLVARSSVRRADRVIAVSDFVHDFLVSAWNIADDKIGVVPHGIEPALPPAQRTMPPALGVLREGAMLFTAGSIRPARGLDDAIGALELLVARAVPAHLVIAGTVSGNAARYRGELGERIARRGLSDRVIWAGELSAPEMGWCFARCTAFVMTSRVEACSNTALEALSYGAPCVATSRRPMPETFETAATYYAAGDAAALAGRIVDVIRMSSGERALASRRAEERSHRFVWAKTAHETVRQLSLAVR